MKKFLSVFLVSTLTISLLGCGKTDTKQSNVVDSIANNTISANIDNSTLLSKLNTGFKSASIDEDYNTPLYQLDKDHIFEFEASESAGNVAYKAFSVYDNADFENRFSASYCECSYENGKIKVAPNSVLSLNGNSSTYASNGTWGSLNKMYLVQNIDLQTGEDLANPIVTPFSIQHDLDTPTLSQSVNEDNLYTLSWSPVNGATEYRVYEHFGDTAYQLECVTSNTSVTVEEFKTQKKSENYDDLVKQDLQNAGYTVDEGYTSMNNGAKYTDDFDGYFTVVAVDASGRQSGISNIVDVRDIANRLPHIIKNNITVTIDDILDAPTYVDVEMIDGSIAQMLIDYHGAQTYKYEDSNKVTIAAHVCNTLFTNFLVTLNGMDYDTFMQNASQITARQDNLNKSGGSSEPVVNIPSTPTNEPTADDETAKEEIENNIPEVTETPETAETEPEGTEVITPDGYSTYDLYLSAVQEVDNRLAQLGDTDAIIYATDKLGAWLAYSMITQMNVIPVPVSVFPEVANEEYLASIFTEAYRQNPTSGVVTNLGYSYEYESLVIEYAEDANTRLNKTVKEIAKAQELAGSIVQSGMSDTEKIISINNYLCANASYDFDSCATDVDMSNLSEAFIDAHTPYGILLNNFGVCESYSEAFALIGRYAGLDVVIETGTLQGGAHEWNRVNADGSWCIVDATNNDMELGSNALLNVTESQIAGILVPDYTAYRGSFSAIDNTKEFYYINDMCASSSSDAENILSEQLKIGDIAQVRLPLGTSEEEAVNIAKSVMQSTGVQLQDAIYFANIVALRK